MESIRKKAVYLEGLFEAMKKDEKSPETMLQQGVISVLRMLQRVPHRRRTRQGKIRLSHLRKNREDHPRGQEKYAHREKSGGIRDAVHPL